MSPDDALPTPPSSPVTLSDDMGTPAKTPPKRTATERKQAKLAADLRRITAQENDRTEKKEAIIREMRAAGMSLRQIAEHTDVSHTGIARICGESP